MLPDTEWDLLEVAVVKVALFECCLRSGTKGSHQRRKDKKRKWKLPFRNWAPLFSILMGSLTGLDMFSAWKCSLILSLMVLVMSTPMN